MTAPKFTRTYLNDAYLGVYDYAHAGDTLPVHHHARNPEQEHCVIVCGGEFMVLGGTAEAPVDVHYANPGDIVTWPIGAAHGFRALSEGGGRCIHVRAASLKADVVVEPAQQAAVYVLRTSANDASQP